MEHLEWLPAPHLRRLDAPGPACPYTVVTMTGIEVPLDSSRDMRQQSGLHYCLVSSCLHGHGKPTYAHCSCWPVRTGSRGCRGMTLGGFLLRKCVKYVAKAPRLGAPPSRLPGHGGEDRGCRACHCLVPASLLRR